MIMKANKQIGFIYKDNESIDKILKDGDVVFERGFLREKTSTTLPITFGGVGKNLKDYKIYGNTYQNSTSGKNLYGISDYSNTVNGVEITIKDGAITLNGTCSSNTTLVIDPKEEQNLEGNYNMSLNLLNGTYTGTANVNLRNANDNSIIGGTQLNCHALNKGFTLPTTNIKYGIYFTKNTVFDNLIIRPQLVAGTEPDYDYEPYTGGQPSPNPDYPQEIISCGDRTKNLYNNDTSTKTILSLQGVETANDSWTTSDYIKIKKNLDYIFSWQPIVASNLYWQTRVSYYDSNKQFISGENLNSYPGTNKFYQTITNIPENTEYIRISFSNRVDSNSERKNVQLEEGSVNTPYEPYGYKIPVNVRSDNLFDKDNANVLNAYIGTNKVITTSEYDKTLYIKCKPNTTYTISKMISSPTNQNKFRVCTTTDIPTIGTTGIDYVGYNTGTEITNITITTSSSANYLCVFMLNVNSSTTTLEEMLVSIQIVEGSTAPSKYIPYYNETTNIYLDEPLRKIGDYIDYIDFKNGKVVRNIKEVVLDGSENWTTAVTRKSYNKVARQFLLGNAILNQGNSSNITKSTHFRSESANNIYSNSSIGINCIGISDSGYLRIGLDLTVFPGDNSFKTWLSENNVTVDYVLETPTEEDIELPNIPTIDGNNTLNIETEITPSQVYIKYKSNE